MLEVICDCFEHKAVTKIKRTILALVYLRILVVMKSSSEFQSDFNKRNEWVQKNTLELVIDKCST